MCWKCKNDIQETSVFFNSTCAICKADLHCCKNCKLYEIGSRYDCKEPNVDECVFDKEKANFCDWFSLKKTGFLANSRTAKSLDARASFANLFGEK